VDVEKERSRWFRFVDKMSIVIERWLTAKETLYGRMFIALFSIVAVWSWYTGRDWSVLYICAYVLGVGFLTILAYCIAEAPKYWYKDK